MSGDRWTVATLFYFDAAGELGDASETTRILGPTTTTLEQWIAARSTGGTARTV